jgi:glycerophosphoryl diester phosphodiesterase
MGKNLCFISLVLILLLTSTCKKVDLSASKNLEAGRILVFGHGGSGFPTEKNPYPPNSASSVFRAIDFLGADGVEIDVQLSGDSTLVLYHDEDLSTQTACQGCIAKTVFADIKKCSYRRYYQYKPGEEGIAALKEILERFKQYQKVPLVSVNVHLQYNCLNYDDWEKYFKTFANSLAKILNKYKAHEWVFVESGNPDFLKLLGIIDPNMQLYYDAPVNQATIEECVKNNWMGLVSPLDESPKDLIKIAHDKKLKVAVYNVKLRNEIREAIVVNPDFIQSDNVLLLKQYLSE